MKLMILADDPEYIISDRLLGAFGIPEDYQQVMRLFEADALLIAWNETNWNFKNAKETMMKHRKPVYEIVWTGQETKYIRRLPTLNQEHANNQSRVG